MADNAAHGAVAGYRVKRALDLVCSLFLIVALALPMLIVAILVRTKLGSPVIFTQERSGARGKPFRILKFRTMTNQRGSDGELLPDEIRLTGFGQFLRSSSLDELPELFNILLGRMSFVGPRPLPTIYVPRYSQEQARRLNAKPGLTGWAQINGRNSIDWEERFKLDLWYLDNVTLLLDLRIFFLTFGKVFARAGISAAGEATMSEFRGNA